MPLLAERQPDSTQTERRISEEMEEAIRWLARGGLVGYYNETVLAVITNVNDPDLLPKLQTLKKDDSRSTVGLTVPFRDIVPMADTEAISNPAHRRLLRDEHDELTGRYAGVGFLRFPAKEELVDNPAVPQILIGRDPATGRPTGQGWSPTGVDKASRLLRAAKAYQPDTEQGEMPILPGMTSGNIHGKAEIATPKAARKFVRKAQRRGIPIMLLDLGHRTTPDSRPLGSYPILSVRIDEQGQSHLERSRQGCFDEAIIESLMDGYDIDMFPEGYKAAVHQKHIFTNEDILEPYRKLHGPYKRLGLLATLGWHADASAMLQDRLQEDL